MRSPQNTATPLESPHVPVSAAAATTGPTPPRALRERVVGATAIASAAAVLIDNVVVGWVNSPTYGAPMKEVLAFHANHPGAVATAVGLEALNVPLLLGFLTGLHGLVGRRGGAGAHWSRLAMAAGATLSAVTAFYAVLWDGVVLTAARAIGEYGAVALVSGNIAGETQTATLRVEDAYQFSYGNYAPAYGIAFVLAATAILVLVAMLVLQPKGARH